MHIITTIMDVILHLDVHLTELVTSYGIITYFILFAIIFAETGLVVTPFLPGDSLLFASGAIAALGGLHVGVVITILLVAAILGDTANYWIGHFFGKALVENPKVPINQEHITKTEQFFKKYGGKTIIIARFVPIVRTFAPFVAGVGTMEYKKFILYNIIGGSLWVLLFTLAGYFFGNMPFVRHNFHYVVFVIIGLSLLPILYEFIQHQREKRSAHVSEKLLKERMNE